MRPSVNTPSSRAYKLVCRTILILLVATGLVAGIFKMAVSSASPQEQATARFEQAARQVAGQKFDGRKQVSAACHESGRVGSRPGDCDSAGCLLSAGGGSG